MTTTKNKLKKFLAIVLLTAAITIEGNQFAYAQLQQITGSTNNSWRTQANPLVNRIGIGNFINGTNLFSVLTVDGTLVPVPTGEVFRTDAPAGTTAWRMFSANVAANQKFAIVNPAGSNN